jgi:methyltransferase-like protein/SAM-dependent methyltransferase
MTVSYDQVPYPSHSFGVSHPDHLATLAALLGMSPEPVEHCKVLELGCASGGNLIPMAVNLPESEFLGIDHSARQVGDGQMAVAALDLKNIQLRHMDIMDVTADLGQFHYIIVHGIYSWVPDPVRDKILQICKQNLAPNGVAYISYNAYPGWYMLRAIREMMLYHTRNVTEPEMRVAQARALLDFLVESVPAEAGSTRTFLNAYSDLIKKETERWKTHSDSFMLHDELEEVNEPFYFYQFAERAARHGLQYLTDANFSDVFPGNLPPQVRENLFKMAHSLVEMEQYMDFIRGETFRRTLLVHEGVPITRSVRADRLPTLYISSPAAPVSVNPDMHSVSIEQFRNAEGATLTIDHPASKAAMMFLGEIWPRIVSFDVLLNAAYARLDLSASPSQRVRDAQVLCANLLKAFAYNNRLVELHSYAPRFVTDVTERPVASPYARYQAQDSLQVTNVRHERVDLNKGARYLLSQLDGEHDRATLLDGLLALREEGVLVIHRDEKPVEDLEEAKALIAEDMEHDLRTLARAALLVA